MKQLHGIALRCSIIATTFFNEFVAYSVINNEYWLTGQYSQLEGYCNSHNTMLRQAFLLS